MDPSIDSHRDQSRHELAGDKARYWVLSASILGSSMAFVNNTAVNMALDPMMADLGASLGETLWIASIYTLFLAALMLPGGAAGDFYGRRKIFIWGVSLFTLASFAGAVAPTAFWLVLARGVQGIGAACIAPMSLTLIAEAFAPAHRARAIGIWSAVSAIMTALGPPIGGWLAAHESWRLIFHLNLPFGIATLLITVFLTRAKPAPRRGERLAIESGLYAVITCLLISYALISLSDDVSKFTRAPAALSWLLPIMLGFGAFGLFINAERRSPNPMIPGALFKIRSFAIVNVLTMCHYAAMGGLFVFYPIILNDAYGLGVDRAGIVFLGFVIPMAGITSLSGVILGAVAIQTVLAAGSLIAAIGFALMGLFEFSGTMGGAFTAMFIYGVGMGLVVPGMNHTLFHTTPDSAHGSASGFNNAVARAATLFAIVGYGVVVAQIYDAYLIDSVSTVAFGSGDSLEGAARLAYRQAMTQSFKAITWVSIAFTLLAALIAIIWRARTRADGAGYASANSPTRHF